VTLHPPSNQNAEFLSALSLETGKSPAPVRKAAAALAVVPSPAPDVVLGEADTGGAVGFDLSALIEGRLLIQGVSGAGKSWTLRRLLEQSAGRVQQIIIDPEGEFSTLAEPLGLTRLDAAKLLGMDNKTICTWCIAGDLKATKRGTKRLVQQGGDTWSIQPADLRAFVIDNLERIDIRKVEKFSFVALIADGTGAKDKGSLKQRDNPDG
jgi:DNA helicase HerA-like ATPase